MPEIRPFRGILYNPQKIKDIAKVVTEPYDVISPVEQASYYRKHPYNVIRLILGRHFSEDDNKNNQYTRAKKYFNDWLKRGILLGDEQESIYIYSQSFSHNGQQKVRTGFIVLLKLEDFAKNIILPHENTFCKAVQDRLKLLKETSANLSPIFAVFIDPQAKVNKILNQYKKGERPCAFIEKDKVIHRLWRMSQKRKIAAVRKLLKQRQIFIADGHHRYEAALNYKLQRQKSARHPRASFNYVMVYLVPTADPGLTILPTHRVVKLKGSFRMQEAMRNLKKVFQLQAFSTAEGLFSFMRRHNSKTCIFGAYFGKHRFYGLKLKAGRPHHKELDVDVLHNVIIERISTLEQTIYYTRDAQEAIKLVEAGKYQAAFFLRPTTVKEVKKAAFAGKKMPHKSTYFYPKLLTGLVINKL